MIEKIIADCKMFLSDFQLASLEHVLHKHLDYKSSDEDLIQKFIDIKKLECCSEKTLEQYEGRLRYFSRNIEINDLRLVTKNTIRDFLSDYQKKGVSTRTLDNMRLYLSTFYKWLEDEDIITKSPVRSIKSIKTKKVVKNPFTSLDVIKLLDNCSTNREQAIVETLLSTGCRVSELVNIKFPDIHNKETTILGKGNKERKVYFSDQALYAINNYMSSRNDSCEFLFVSCKGQEVHSLTTGHIRKLLRELSEKSGVDNVHPHRFRRTLASNLLNKGMPIQEVSEILGHSSIETTMIYCEINQEQVKHDHKKFLS